MAYIVMAYIVMAYIVMIYIVMAHVARAYTVMVYAGLFSKKGFKGLFCIGIMGIFCEFKSNSDFEKDLCL